MFNWKHKNDINKEKSNEGDYDEINKKVSELKEDIEGVKQASKIISTKVSELEEISKEEKWIWVEGYKGTDKDMCCQPGDIDSKMQYKLGKEFTCNGDIIYGQNGFHFCKQLKDVVDRYCYIDLRNRFFKIKGLVKEKDYNKGYDHQVAKKIYFLEEVTYKDLANFINRKFKWEIKESEYYKYKNEETLIKDKFLYHMKQLGFSELFTQVEFDSIRVDKAYDFFKLAKAYTDEDISKDLTVYLLEKNKNNFIY